MKPIINLDDHAGKTVGRRAYPSDSFAYGMRLQETMAQVYGRFPIRRGVYKFHSHEEADAWMMNLLARRKES